jgi:hypothetical protein
MVPADPLLTPPLIGYGISRTSSELGITYSCSKNGGSSFARLIEIQDHRAVLADRVDEPNPISTMRSILPRRAPSLLITGLPG